ncbi:DUF6541 family protein [Leucobacter massiliensis]|uniref:Glycosyltransferase RgtA/B/C/D-like domain-containing protein n=1 Tax=Leucobacter massiliensis TaxID=1686285 RepID=A0A2S9QKV1_9MICO|nr:DUF6541 family protein [Leucobacter massiliensis]PRI10221.1 hypothetical protein B4915_12480 [Leucobacter massiliensis]
MTWLTAVLAALAAAALLLVPGLLTGWCIGLRRLWLWALAPAVSVTLLCAGSVVLPLLGLSWTPLWALLFAAVFGALVVLLFRFVLRARFAAPEAESGRRWPTVVAWAFCAVMLLGITVSGIGAPSNFSQTFDNVFHLNAIALIGDTGNASPFEIARLTSPDGGGEFYPNGWHALVQLTQQLSGGSIPLAINAFNLAVVAIVWPLGMLLLSRQVAGSSRTATLATGVLAAAFPAVPVNLLHYGVLYPFFFGMALAPATLAVVLNLLGTSRERRVSTIAPLIVLLAGVAFAISIAHPGAMLAVLAVTVPVATVALCAGWRGIGTRRRLWRAAGYAVFFAIGLAMLIGLRQGDWWGARMSPAEAAWQTVSLSLWGYGMPLLTAALMVLGIVLAVRRRDRVGAAAVGMWLVAAVLFFVTAGLSNYWLRLPTWVWYGDAPRLAALYPIVVVPLAVLAVRWLVDLVSRRAPRAWVPEAVVLLVVSAVALSTAGYPELLRGMRDGYTAKADSALLSTDELKLLERLPQEVGEDEVIAGNPWTGTSLAFAFAERRVVLPHILMNEVGKDRSLVMEHLDDAKSDPAVCDAADRLGVRFVLDFGDREVHGGDHDYAGIDNLEDSGAFELVDQQGDARLFRLTACD